MRTFRSWMICAGIALGLPAAASASGSADAVKIYEADAASVSQAVKHFAVNRELGRAWIEITLYSPSPGDDGATPAVERVRVPGLRFDAERSAVVYEAGGQVVECARVETRKALLGTRDRIQPTGQCALSGRTVEARVDNGFEMEDRRRYEVYLDAAADVG